MRYDATFGAAATLVVAALVSIAGPAGAVDPPPFILEWGSEGSGPGQFNRAADVAFGPAGNVYVADARNHRIQKFTPDGQYLTEWGTYGTAPGQFNHVARIEFDSDWILYVCDTFNCRVQAFTSDGQFLTQWGSCGSGVGQLNNPEGLAVDPDGFVYVADTLNHRVVKYALDGTFLTTLIGSGNFQAPTCVEVDEYGNLYAANIWGDERINKFSNTGDLITWWGSYGSGPGQFHDVYGITSSPSDDTIYVADLYNHRIQQFSDSGSFLTMWGVLGDGQGEFLRPHGVGVGPDGHIYVTEGGNHRVQKFGYETTRIQPDSWGQIKARHR